MTCSIGLCVDLLYSKVIHKKGYKSIIYQYNDVHKTPQWGWVCMWVVCGRGGEKQRGPMKQGIKRESEERVRVTEKETEREKIR